MKLRYLMVRVISCFIAGQRDTQEISCSVLQCFFQYHVSYQWSILCRFFEEKLTFWNNFTFTFSLCMRFQLFGYYCCTQLACVTLSVRKLLVWLPNSTKECERFPNFPNIFFILEFLVRTNCPTGQIKLPRGLYMARRLDVPQPWTKVAAEASLKMIQSWQTKQASQMIIQVLKQKLRLSKFNLKKKQYIFTPIVCSKYPWHLRPTFWSTLVFCHTGVYFHFYLLMKWHIMCLNNYLVFWAT